MAKLQTRAASATFLIPLVILIILYGSWPFIGLVLACIGITLYEWFHLASKTKHKIAYLIIGLLYITISFWSCYAIRELHSVQAAVLLMALIWASDIGAYFTGTFLGGPKMAKEISPNKTWAGFAGALAFPALLSIIWVAAFDLYYGTLSSGFMIYAYSFVVGIVIGAVGQAGDLVISFIKRQAQVKDTGALIPGHGGLLDRVDSLMLAAPVFLFFIAAMSYAP